MGYELAEPARRIPIEGSWDVAVAGGGMAGVSAAVAAARAGSRVILIERYAALGGLATLGNVSLWLPICDGNGRQVIGGLGEELLHLSVAELQEDWPLARFQRPPRCWTDRTGRLSERRRSRYRAAFNPAAYLLALERWVLRAGITLLYDTRFCAVRKEGDRITHLILEGKEGRFAVACRAVVDATGDADVCVAAGEPTVSLRTNVAAGWYYTLENGALFLRMISRRYGARGERINGNGPFYGGGCSDQVTAHLVASRALIRADLAERRRSQPSAQPLMIPTAACFRMTRRLSGRVVLTERHVHRLFPDAVGFSGDWRRAGPIYAIPLRALQGVRTGNLVVAGRCLSARGGAWDALRAIPSCVVTGQGAGAAAALAAARKEKTPGAIDSQMLQTVLKKQGVLLDPALLRPAAVGAGGERRSICGR